MIFLARFCKPTEFIFALERITLIASIGSPSNLTFSTLFNHFSIASSVTLLKAPFYNQIFS